MGLRRFVSRAAAALMMSGISMSVALADDAAVQKVLGEKIYVPAFSHIDTQSGVRQPLASTVVVHNVDPEAIITLQSVTYHNEVGEQVRSFLEAPIELGPFGSASFLTEINDNSGGNGANYIVIWESPDLAQSPIAHAVMIGGTGTQGISFVTQGRVIERSFSQ